jgi:hypothetical protein
LVTRFDLAKKQYEYEVSENVEDKQAVGTPYQIPLATDTRFKIINKYNGYP